MAEKNEQTQGKRTWKALGGAALFILGMLALNATTITSFAAVYTLGWILTVGGIVGFVLSFAIHNTGGIIMGMISSILSFVLGVIMLTNPAVSLATFTLLLAMYFVVDGIIRIAVAIGTPVENKGWSLLYGIVLLALGIAVWVRLPTSSLYIFGIFIGIALILNGITTLATSVSPIQMRQRTQRPRFA